MPETELGWPGGHPPPRPHPGGRLDQRQAGHLGFKVQKCKVKEVLKYLSLCTRNA